MGQLHFSILYIGKCMYVCDKCVFREREGRGVCCGMDTFECHVHVVTKKVLQ